MLSSGMDMRHLSTLQRIFSVFFSLPSTAHKRKGERGEEANNQ
jgi:hypothetical protein